MSLEEIRPSVVADAETVLRELPAAVLVVSADGQVVVHNPAAGRLLGDAGADFVGQRLLDRFPGGDEGLVRAFLQRVARSEPGASAHVEARITRVDGLVRHVELLGSRLPGNPEAQAIVLHLVDVTRYVRQRDEANRDPLTNLPNRLAIQGAMEAAWRRLAAGSGGPVTVIFCDLDRFKVVNDRYGHTAGDAVLAEVARRLEQVAGHRGSLGRFGGDEFVVVLDDDLGWQSIAEAILAAVATPIPVDGATVEVTVSLGVARATDADGGPGRLLRNADTAMYMAKESGRGRWHLHDGTIKDPNALAAIASLEAELRTDYLTGVGNLRGLTEHLHQTHETARRTRSPYVVAFVDGDQFGEINKRYGQDTGDAVVQAMARGLLREVRSGDMVFRRGGDEFIVVLRDTTISGAQGWLDRVRDGLAMGLDGAPPIPITVSAGLAAFDPETPARSPGEVMDRADFAMRQAKAAGRNRVVVA